MKCYFVVLCAVFLNANSKTVGFYWKEYGVIPERAFPNDKGGNDKYLHTGEEDTNTNDLDLDKESAFPDDKESNYKDLYTSQDHTNMNGLDLDMGSGFSDYRATNDEDLDMGSVTTEDTERVIPSYKPKEGNYFIKNCPTSMRLSCRCECSPTCPCACKQALEDKYYWLEYKGVIPENALPAGKNTYIGQVDIESHGIYVGSLTPGVKEIEVSAYGVKKQDYRIRILCTKHEENFCWLNTTSTTFHDDVEDKFAVIGGYDVHNNGDLNIGRVVKGESLKLGGISSFEPNNVYLWYPEGKTDFMAVNYEVLIYDEST